MIQEIIKFLEGLEVYDSIEVIEVFSVILLKYSNEPGITIHDMRQQLHLINDEITI